MAVVLYIRLILGGNQVKLSMKSAYSFVIAEIFLSAYYAVRLEYLT